MFPYRATTPTAPYSIQGAANVESVHAENALRARGAVVAAEEQAEERIAAAAAAAAGAVVASESIKWRARTERLESERRQQLRQEAELSDRLGLPCQFQH